MSYFFNNNAHIFHNRLGKTVSSSGVRPHKHYAPSRRYTWQSLFPRSEAPGRPRLRPEYHISVLYSDGAIITHKVLYGLLEEFSAAASLRGGVCGGSGGGGVRGRAVRRRVNHY